MFQKKIRLDFSCESSERIHLKHQVLFSLKNNEKIFKNVVCCSHDWCFKGYNYGRFTSDCKNACQLICDKFPTESMN